MMWFSVVAWSVRADLLMVDINIFSAPCVFPIFVLSSSFLCSSSRVLSSLVCVRVCVFVCVCVCLCACVCKHVHACYASGRECERL